MSSKKKTIEFTVSDHEIMPYKAAADAVKMKRRCEQCRRISIFAAGGLSGAVVGVGASVGFHLFSASSSVITTASVSNTMLSPLLSSILAGAAVGLLVGLVLTFVISVALEKCRQNRLTKGVANMKRAFNELSAGSSSTGSDSDVSINERGAGEAAQFDATQERGDNKSSASSSSIGSTPDVSINERGEGEAAQFDTTQERGETKSSASSSSIGSIPDVSINERSEGEAAQFDATQEGEDEEKRLSPLDPEREIELDFSDEEKRQIDGFFQLKTV